MSSPIVCTLCCVFLYYKINRAYTMWIYFWISSNRLNILIHHWHCAIAIWVSIAQTTTQHNTIRNERASSCDEHMHSALGTVQVKCIPLSSSNIIAMKIRKWIINIIKIEISGWRSWIIHLFEAFLRRFRFKWIEFRKKAQIFVQMYVIIG